jgi:DNA-binding NtrC family response regulator
MIPQNKLRCLIVDDDEAIRKLCGRVAESAGIGCSHAESARAALQAMELDPPEIVLSDLVLPDMNGLDFLRQAKRILPRVEIAIMTGHGSIETAVQAMRLGAYDYITKPFVRLEELKILLQRMEEKVRLVNENQFLRERVSAELELNGIVGSSAKIQEVLRIVARLKDTRTPVLITGESGTGKELVARAIHYRGVYAQRPFVAVDCGSLVPTLIESELFGYEKGAFTGAAKSKEGLFQHADGGTIFLDEIGELPLEMQAKLLRVLQEKEVRPVGSNRSVKVDVRVIAATNRDLEAEYREGKFRKDLFFRLNVVSVHVPALRERRSDIPMLLQHFLGTVAPERALQIAPPAMEALLSYEWPGNVRELENCMERAVALGSQNIVGVHDLPPAIQRMAAPRQNLLPSRASFQAPVVQDSATDLEELERATILRVFEQTNGDKTLTGKMLGISRATLYRKLKRYCIGPFEKSKAASAL